MQLSARACAAAALALGLAAWPAAAQTSDDLFNGNVLHEIRLDIHPADWQKLKSGYLENTYYPCNFQWGSLTVPYVGIRSRGTGSRSDVKPGLRVDFDRYEYAQEFLGLKSVVLRNNTQDASMLHERVAMLFFQRMGLPAPREAHTRLYVNDEYVGLYTIVESVDKRFLKRVFGENDGYLYEYKWAEKWLFEYRGPDLWRYSPAPFQPETHEKDPNPAPLEAMVRAVNQSSDTDFVRAVSDYLDLRLFMVHVGIENFLAETDGFLGDWGINNFYFYRFEGKNLSQFIAWDKSHTFQGVSYPIWRNAYDNVLMRRALAVPELRNAYLETLYKSALSAGGAGGWLEAEIARQYAQVRQAALEDKNKQCLGSDGMPRPCTNEEFEKDVAALATFARLRSDFVLRELAAAGYVPPGGPSLNAGGAVNAATFSGAVLAPGSLISVFGERLSLVTGQASALPLPTEFAGVSVRINNTAAPLVYVSPWQVNLQLPWEVGPGTATITASLNGAAGNSIPANMGLYSPGVFAVVHGADNSPITAENPAVGGEVLVVYANGLGPVKGEVTTGQASPGSPPATTAETPGVIIGGVAGGVEFSGLTPGLVGLYQVNVRVPGNVAAGERTPLVLSISGQAAPPFYLVTR